jgi:Na+/H+ antiporter NhaB
MNFFISCFIIGCIIGVSHEIYLIFNPVPKPTLNDEYQKWFYNTPEENQRIEELNHFRSFCRSLLSTAAIVLITLLLYLLC